MVPQKCAFFGKTDIIGHIGQPLENNYSRMELFTKDEIPSKFDKIKKMTEILYSIRPEIGKYCWDSTIFRDNEHLDVPEEMTRSRVQVEGAVKNQKLF